MQNKKVSILMLTHNAPGYVKLTVESLVKHTKNVDYELCVIDNASKRTTRVLLKLFYRRKMIQKVIFSSYNTLFASGNNILSSVADKDADYFLLLNSDIEIKDDNWLSKLLDVHKKGVTSYGVVESEPYRVDGYCYLIDADLYRKYPLDERNFQWFWAITKQQAQVLTSGYSVQGFRNHEEYLHHFGGKSGGDFMGAEGMNTPAEVSKKWFRDKRPKFL
jgi:glycosyltransferase involved in cell wall biosynthesis